MSKATKDDAAAAGAELVRQDKLEAALLSALGTPLNFSHVTVTPIFKDHYRVNVYQRQKTINPDSHMAMPWLLICDSFFVEADEDGEIIDSTPALVRKHT